MSKKEQRPALCGAPAGKTLQAASGQVVQAAGQAPQAAAGKVRQAPQAAAGRAARARQARQAAAGKVRQAPQAAAGHAPQAAAGRAARASQACQGTQTTAGKLAALFLACVLWVMLSAPVAQAQVYCYREGKLVPRQDNTLLWQSVSSRKVAFRVGTGAKKTVWETKKYTGGADQLELAGEPMGDVTMTIGEDIVVIDWEELKKRHLPALFEIYRCAFVLARKYSTPSGLTRIPFTRSDGKTELMKRGSFIWQLNVEKTAEAIQEALNEGRTFAAPVWRWKTGGTYLGPDSVGSSYVEVNIRQQKVWVYDRGELVLETDCVTGTKGTKDTWPGIWRITTKMSPAVLRGADYETPVSYWMPFYDGQGLHDAAWRGSFGGTIYQSSGSHGCVNLPPASAKKIYETVQTGWPVVILKE